MRRLTVCLLILLTAAFAADRDLAGRYTGEWKSTASGNGGTIRFTLDANADGTWKSELSFGVVGEEVKTTMKAVKVQDSKVELTYDWEAMGITATSYVTGAWEGTAFKGTYQSKLSDGSTLDAGTWNASRAK